VKRLREAYKRAAIFDVRLKLYPDARHEVLNETNRQEVTNDLIAWLDEIVAAQV
jgi:alpha-beta hydrolase superfamily lysophospholipase